MEHFGLGRERSQKRKHGDELRASLEAHVKRCLGISSMRTQDKRLMGWTLGELALYGYEFGLEQLRKEKDPSTVDFKGINFFDAAHSIADARGILNQTSEPILQQVSGSMADRFWKSGLPDAIKSFIRQNPLALETASLSARPQPRQLRQPPQSAAPCNLVPGAAPGKVEASNEGRAAPAPSRPAMRDSGTQTLDPARHQHTAWRARPAEQLQEPRPGAGLCDAAEGSGPGAVPSWPRKSGSRGERQLPPQPQPCRSPAEHYFANTGWRKPTPSAAAPPAPDDMEIKEEPDVEPTQTSVVPLYDRQTLREQLLRPGCRPRPSQPPGAGMAAASLPEPSQPSCPGTACQTTPMSKRTAAAPVPGRDTATVRGGPEGPLPPPPPVPPPPPAAFPPYHDGRGDGPKSRHRNAAAPTDGRPCFFLPPEQRHQQDREGQHRQHQHQQRNASWRGGGGLGFTPGPSGAPPQPRPHHPDFHTQDPHQHPHPHQQQQQQQGQRHHKQDYQRECPPDDPAAGPSSVRRGAPLSACRQQQSQPAPRGPCRPEAAEGAAAGAGTHGDPQPQPHSHRNRHQPQAHHVPVEGGAQGRTAAGGPRGPPPLAGNGSIYGGEGAGCGNGGGGGWRSRAPMEPAGGGGEAPSYGSSGSPSASESSSGATCSTGTTSSGEDGAESSDTTTTDSGASFGVERSDGAATATVGTRCVTVANTTTTTTAGRAPAATVMAPAMHLAAASHPALHCPGPAARSAAATATGGGSGLLAGGGVEPGPSGSGSASVTYHQLHQEFMKRMKARSLESKLRMHLEKKGNGMIRQYCRNIGLPWTLLDLACYGTALQKLAPGSALDFSSAACFLARTKGWTGGERLHPPPGPGGRGGRAATGAGVQGPYEPPPPELVYKVAAAMSKAATKYGLVEFINRQERKRTRPREAAAAVAAPPPPAAAAVAAPSAPSARGKSGWRGGGSRGGGGRGAVASWSKWLESHLRKHLLRLNCSKLQRYDTKHGLDWNPLELVALDRDVRLQQNCDSLQALEVARRLARARLPPGQEVPLATLEAVSESMKAVHARFQLGPIVAKEVRKRRKKHQARAPQEGAGVGGAGAPGRAAPERRARSEE